MLLFLGCHLLLNVGLPIVYPTSGSDRYCLSLWWQLLFTLTVSSVCLSQYPTSGSGSYCLLLWCQLLLLIKQESILPGTELSYSESTRRYTRYGGHLLAPGQGFGKAYFAVLANLRQLLVFSSYLRSSFVLLPQSVCQSIFSSNSGSHLLYAIV